MNIQGYSRSGLAACIVLVGVIGCRALETPEDRLLTNPSFHILVNDERSIPETGTFDFDTKLFKIDYSKEMDLAAVDTRVTSSIEAELERKGFKRATEAPDLLVSYAVAMDSVITGSDFNAAYAEDYPIEIPEPAPGQELNYHQGALIVDFIDSDTRELFWRGAIMAEVSMDVSENEKDRRVRHGVEILLGHFPTPIVE